MIKKTIYLTLLLFVLTSGVSIFGQSLGDVDCNGTVNIIDALLIAQYYVGLIPELGVCSDEVTFPDPVLEKSIRNKIGKPTEPIYKSDVEQINDISLHINVTDLTGIEYLSNLEALYITNTIGMTDFTELQKLEKLKTLYLSNSTLLLEDSKDILDLNFLSSMLSLRTLHLYGNSISDVSPLKSLIYLQDLNLEHNDIEDITPLSEIKCLEKLNLIDNKMQDISPLAKLGYLEDLNVSKNNISDISSLTEFKNLKTLDIGYNPISDISVLSLTPSLENLSLSGLEIVDFTPITGFYELISLQIADCGLTEIPPEIIKYPEIKVINIGFNKISDISMLVDFKYLEQLWINNNPISDISCLLELPNLKVLFSIHLHDNDSIYEVYHILEARGVNLMP